MATTITAAEVKKLRDQTGAGMMECKNALMEANGDFEEANTILRKRGLASAAKKAGDAATEAWLKDPQGPIIRHVAPVIAKLGENMGVSRFVRFAGQGYVGQYVHRADGSTGLGGKIAVMVELAGVTPDIAKRDELAALVKEIAMQIAAASPTYVSRETVPADVLEKEKGIYRAQMESSGKPANVIDKIVEGKLGSFYSQVVLPDQLSIRDPKMTVKDVLAAASKNVGAPLVVTRFARLKVGEAAV